MIIRTPSRRALPAFLLLLGALGVLSGSPLAATSYVMVSDEALVDRASLAVVGRIVSVDRSVLLPNGGGSSLATEYRVEVEESLKGEAPAGALRVHVPGGRRADGMALRIYGAPRFHQGERALLFLEPDGRGGYRPLHLLLGAFHEVAAGGRSFAVRNLNEASAMRVTAGGLEEVDAKGREPLRDFAAFARWIKARGAGMDGAAAYQVADPDGSLRQITGKYTLFEDPDDFKNLRWFGFDTAGHVSWKAFSTGQQGLTGGGYNEFRAALQAWNAETQTPIDYRYDGTTASTNGLGTYDQINSIVFNDPAGDLPAFDCNTGGVLGSGGPWYDGTVSSNHQGASYHVIVNADIVINRGIGCFFSASHNASKAAEELFGHELGHTLGLGHSCGDSDTPDPNCTNPTFSDALMRAYVHDDGRGARLNSDDQAGIRALYKPATGGLPAAPTNLTAAPTSTSVIHLQWQDHATNETEFRIEVKLLGGTYADAGSVPANSTAADVIALTPATGYSFRVRAHNASGYSAYSNEVIAATLAPVAPCVADANTLCLSGGRFRVQVAWKTGTGTTGAASVVPVTSDSSGLLYFFDPNNWEMLIKVLNACGLGTPRYWVFFAATTNVQYTVTVTDTQTGAVKVYFNPLNNSAAAVTDSNAFATCP